MEKFSEQAIKENCPNCSIGSRASARILEQTDNFYTVCDDHPLTEGHILIIPKQHISCVGAYPEDIFKEFLELNDKVSQFLTSVYKSVSSFEHGIYGQTVFHAHTHYFPFEGEPIDIVPEGKDKLSKINDLSKLKTLFKRDGGYLFFSLGEDKWNVDVTIAVPRFFRDRYAKALGKPERADWKTMHENQVLMQEAEKDNANTQANWKSLFNQ